MESLKSHSANPGNMLHHAKRLSDASQSIITLLAQETIRIGRIDQSQHLAALRYIVLEKLDWAKHMEHAASYGDSKVKLALSVAGLATLLVAGENKSLRAVSRHLLNNHVNQQSFGTVLVSVGPGGLPEDVKGVTVSKLARESNRSESQVIKELHEGGCLLFTEEAFSSLIDKLITDVQEGRLLLPVSRETLSQITAPVQIESKAIRPMYPLPP